MFVLSIRLTKRRRRIFLSGVALILVVALSVIASSAIRLYFEENSVDAVSVEPFKKTVIIDAGHGGEDCGAIGTTGVYEKDLNLEIAFAVGSLLEKEGYLVIYTRNEDKLLYNDDEDVKGIRKISDLKNRYKIAESYPDSLFVSIHMNSFGDKKYSGLQVYYSTRNESSPILANCVQNKVHELLQPDNNRRTKKGDGLYLLENITGEAILVECGFLTNPEECKKLSEKEYQNQLSFAIVCGIIEYVENK